MTDYYTYEQWKKINYHVRKGQKSTSRNDEGVPLFSRKQVEKNSPNYYDNPGDDGPNDDDWAHPDYYDAVENIGDKD